MDDKAALRLATDRPPQDFEMTDTDDRFLSIDSAQTDFEPALSLSRDDPDGPGDEFEADEAALAAERIEPTQTLQTIEALLFSSDVPLSAARLADIVESCTPGAVKKHIASLNEKYTRAGLSFRIEEIARGYQMMTLPDFKPWIAKLNKQRAETRLSAAAMETISIVAYKQPVIRADVEAIRGVACGEVISRLRDMGLVRVLGRAEIVGRPLLYGTTRKFLDVFGLADLDDLPPMEALTLKSASKPIEEVEPVAPKPIPAPPVEVAAAVGA